MLVLQLENFAHFIGVFLHHQHVLALDFLTSVASVRRLKSFLFVKLDEGNALVGFVKQLVPDLLVNRGVIDQGEIFISLTLRSV